MIQTIFKEKEAIQAVDEGNGLWYAGTVESIVDDYSVKVAWTDFPALPSYLIKIPGHLRTLCQREHWPIRKPTHRELTKHRVKRHAISYNPLKCERNIVVSLPIPT